MEDSHTPTADTGAEGTPSPVSPKPSFEEFIRGTFQRLVQMLLSTGASRQDAEDVAQQAFYEAYRRWDTLERPFAWLWVVSRRELARSRARGQLEVPVAEASLARAEELARANERADDAEEAQVLGWVDVSSALDTLPARQREVLALSLLGWTTPEIAEITRLSSATVRSTLRHARRRLADHAHGS